MKRLIGLIAALVLPAAQPVTLIAAVSNTASLVAQAPAKAQSAEAVGTIATLITVRLEGATQGSGVIVKRVDDRYTVLTAWHVVSSQGPREELDIYTSDGKRHQLEQESIKRIGDVDLAVLSFRSSGSYTVASIGDVKSVNSGSNIYVSGFPLPTSAVPIRLFRFLKGDVIANASVAIPNGYQLLYSNPTLPGMSGGAALNAQGQLVGIHASAERADVISESTGKPVATGTNQAVPIAYYSQYSSGAGVIAPTAQAATADDYLAQATQLLDKKGSEQDVIRLSSKALRLRKSAGAYFYRAFAKSELGYKQGAVDDYNKGIELDPLNDNAFYNRGTLRHALGDSLGAIADFNSAIEINPRLAYFYLNRGGVKDALGDKTGAISDYSQAITINPPYAESYYNRALAKYDLGDVRGEIADYNKVIEINPQYAQAYYNRGVAKEDLGDKRGAISDYNQAIRINPQYAKAYANRGRANFSLGNRQSACSDYKSAASFGDQQSTNWLQSGSGAWCRSVF